MSDKISEPESKNRAETSAEQKKNTPLFGRFSRRFFISQLGAAGIAATTQTLLAARHEATTEQGMEDGPAPAPGAIPVTLKINGKDYKLKIEPRVTQSWIASGKTSTLPGRKRGATMASAEPARCMSTEGA